MLSPFALQLRALLVASINAAITLVILLIAPLGLAAVILNTALIALGSYGTIFVSDLIIQQLLISRQDPQQLRVQQSRRSLPSNRPDDGL